MNTQQQPESAEEGENGGVGGVRQCTRRRENDCEKREKCLNDAIRNACAPVCHDQRYHGRRQARSESEHSQSEQEREREREGSPSVEGRSISEEAREERGKGDGEKREGNQKSGACKRNAQHREQLRTAALFAIRDHPSLLSLCECACQHSSALLSQCFGQHRPRD